MPWLALSYRDFIRVAGVSDPGFNGSVEGKTLVDMNTRID
jgi:hypothetical protein